MLTVEKIDPQNRRQVRRFIDLPFRLYAGHPQWVPPIRGDVALMLNRDKHPFYEHSTADFFIASREGRDVGRIAALENRNYNCFHHKKSAQFYLFDCENDRDAATALFAEVFQWARGRHLDAVVGPKGFSPFDGYGLLQRGFEHRQMMNMMNYNHAYYLSLVEAVGFVKEVDFISHYIATEDFVLDERIYRIAERVRRRGKLHTVRFQSKGELKRWAGRLGRTYNETFVNNWEYVPLTDREIQFVLDNILLIAIPKLIKVIAHEEEVVGFAFGFPNISAAMQRSKGRLFPFGIFDLLLELRRTSGLSANGLGILPQYHGRGGNALLYVEMAETVREFGYDYCELTQVAESAVQMRHDLENIGGIPYKNHRVFIKQL